MKKPNVLDARIASAIAADDINALKLVTEIMRFKLNMNYADTRARFAKVIPAIGPHEFETLMRRVDDEAHY